MNLSNMKPKAGALTRLFWYPENADDTTGFKVWLQFLGPDAMREVQDLIKLRGRREGEESPAAFQLAVVQEVCLQAVIRCEKVTFAKLRSMVPLDADEVAKCGGMDAEVPMDPSVSGKSSEARENILFVLDHCKPFSNFVWTICQDIGRFQAADWETRVKNSSTGPATSSA